jgi:hypothetical protein
MVRIVFRELLHEVIVNLVIDSEIDRGKGISVIRESHSIVMGVLRKL